MDLDGGLDFAIMGAGEVGISTADMSDGHTVNPVKSAKQGFRSVGRANFVVAFGGELGVAGAPNGIAFMAEIDIAIAAKSGVAAPFIAWNADECARNLKGVRKPIEFPSERIGDLEIVRLVPDHIHKGPVSAIFEITCAEFVPNVSQDWPWRSPQK
jgi:hypothetical protein